MKSRYEGTKHTSYADFGSSGSVLHTHPDIHHHEEQIKLNVGIIMGIQLSLKINSLGHNKTIDEIMNLQESLPELTNPLDKLKSHLNIIQKGIKHLRCILQEKWGPKLLQGNSDFL